MKNTVSSRLIFLGAGFSSPAGLPLGRNLFSEVRTRIKYEQGLDNHFEGDLNRFLEYLRICDERSVSDEEIDFEEFLAFLDIEHFLGLKGKDTWSSEGNETQLLIRHYIGQILLERTPTDIESIPSLYRKFVHFLNPSDRIFTFNYDNLLERVLDAEGISYRLFPHRFSEINTTFNTIDSSHDDDEIVVTKLHGSIDWFDRTAYNERLQIASQDSISYFPKHPVFGADALVHPIPLVEGPRSHDDPLNLVFRVPDPSPLYQKPRLSCAPLILSPSRTKFIYARPLKDFWWGLEDMGGLNLSLIIVGYSLPVYDEYARMVLYHVARNFTEFEPDLEFLGRKKSAVRILDERSDPSEEKELRDRYRFINPKRCEFWMDGLSEKGIEWLFR